MRVLIADDHPVVRHGLKQILALDPGLELVGEAKNGNEALELARKLEWDVAVLDYSMPGKSGLDLIKEMKSEYPQRPVLVLSMHPEELHADAGAESGRRGLREQGERVRRADRRDPQSGRRAAST